jgi:hypothetical protein
MSNKLKPLTKLWWVFCRITDRQRTGPIGASDVNTFPGIGSFEVTAQLVAFGSSTSESVGDGTIAWHGSISNGSDDLSNIMGLSAGIGSFNLFTAQGSAKEIIQVRVEF